MEVQPQHPRTGIFTIPSPAPCFPLSLDTPLARIPPRQDQDGMLVHPSPSPPLWQQHLAPHIPAVPLPTWQPLGEGRARFPASGHKAFPNNGHRTAQPRI